MSKALDDIATERQRQINSEGWTSKHDDTHAKGELALAAGCYAIGAVYLPDPRRDQNFFKYWPWDWKWWKPRDKRSNLVKAGALIVAEIERLDRVECPNCHDANKYGDYEGPTCDVCHGVGRLPVTCRDCGHCDPCDDDCPNADSPQTTRRGVEP